MRYLEKEIKIRQMEHVEKAIDAMPSTFNNNKKKSGLGKSKSRETMPTKKLVIDEF